MKCLWYQFQISRDIDNDRPMSERIRAHVRSCKRCESFHRGQTELLRHLKPATDQFISPSPFLKNRILNKIVREDCIPARVIDWRLPVTGGFVAVVMAVTFVMVALHQDPGPPQTARARLAPEWIDLTAKVTSGENLFRVTSNLNQPLEQEMKLVIQNAQAVLNSLANDFVPSGLLASKN